MAYAYVVDPKGKVLASSAKGPEVAKDLSRLPQVAAVLAPGGVLLHSGTDASGHAVLTTSTAVPRLGWHVFFEQPTAQALTPIRDQLVRIAFLIALGLVVAIIAGTIMARRMLVPINALRAGARRLGAGDFGHRIEVKTADELEELADQFNSMAGQLAETYSHLESKVQERTRDLAQSINELKVLEEVGRAVSSSLDLNAVLPTVAARALEITHADAVLIYGHDPANHTFNLTRSDRHRQGGRRPASRDRRRQLAARRSRQPGASRSRSPIWTAAADHPLRDVVMEAGFHSVLVVPLVDQQGILGSLVVLRRNAGEFSANLIGLMKTFAHQSVLAMRNARLFSEVDHKSRELEAANSTVREQADKLQEQTDQLKDWNKSLEERVETQLGEIERIRRLERFLAPQVAQLIASSDGHEGLLDSHRREVTVVFCDLRGFTAFTETTEPEEAMNVLREYHAALGELIFRYEGTLDRYAGDGVMILFNAPIQFEDHTARAVKMAVEMRDDGGRADREVAQPRPQSRLRHRHRARLCDIGPDRLRAAARIRRDRQRHQPRLPPVRRSQGQPDRGEPARLRHGRALGGGPADRRFDFEGLQSPDSCGRDYGLAGSGGQCGRCRGRRATADEEVGGALASPLPLAGEGGPFARRARALTVQIQFSNSRRNFAIPRRETPGVCRRRGAQRNQRAQGMPDAPHPRSRVRRAQRKCTRAYRAAEAIRHSLRNGFTAYSVLTTCRNRCRWVVMARI